MRNLFILIFLGINIFAFAQNSEMINFQTNHTWQQVLDSAAKDKKIVFAEIYTDWCSPCKLLAKEVFTNKDVANVFNQRFINYRINAEKGEGITLTKKYGVTGFPYMIFTDWEGNLMYSIVGYRSAKDLIKDADIAFNELKDPKRLGIWDAEYDANKNNPVWLKSYIEKRNKLRMDNNQLLDLYYSFLNPTDYMKAENLMLITKSKGLNLDSKVIKIISQNFDKITPEADSTFHLESGIIGVFDDAINKPLLLAIKDTNESIILNEVVPATSLFPEKVNSMPWFSKHEGIEYEFIFYCQTQNVKKLIPVANDFFQKYYFTMSPEQIRISDSIIYAKSVKQFKKEGMDPSSPMIKQYFSTFTTNDHLEKLVSGAYVVYNNTKEKSELEIALKWATRALDIKEDVTTIEIYVKLLLALKRNDEAVNALQKVIDKTEVLTEKEKLITLMSNIQQNKPL